jgi:predicted flap endonuclease-1-like 5' DNA nuclease
MSESSVDESDINLSKPARSATKTSGATAKVKETDTNDATDSGDQTSLDLDGEVLAETAIDDPNDELQEFDDREYTDADDESDEDPEYEDSDDIDAEYEDDDVDASDEDGEWEYVYEDEDDDESYGEDAEYDDDADYEDDDEVEYLDDASDRMLQSESKGRRKSAAKAQKKASGKKSSTKKTTKQTAGTEEAVVNRSELTDPEPLEQLFDTVDQHDDLQQIFGIGPVTEKALNKLGITSYSQLADLKNHDIEKIADALQIFPGRIERDNWVGSARRQLEEVLEEL